MIRAIWMACAVALAALSAHGSDAATLRLAYDSGFGAASSLDPISPSRFYLANQMLYSRLVRQGEGGLPEADLAVSWTPSADAKEWTFKLREGVTFHDGSDFTAADVVYSLTRIKSETLKSPTRSVLLIVDKVDAVDPHTVRIRLKSPHADFPLLLMDYRVRILSSRYQDGNTDVVNATGVGTGPFMLAKLDPQGTTVLRAYPGYWEGRAGVDEVQIIDITDQSARVQALLSGQVDWAPSVNQQQRKLFEGNPAFTLLTAPSGDWRGIVMRMNATPFSDIRVRKALRILVDREAMKTLLVGRDGGTVSCDDPIWAGDPYHAQLSCPADVPEAKRLLAEAGYPNGLDVELYTSEYDEVFTKMAEVYQDQARAADVRVAIRVVPADGYNNTTWMKRPMFSTTWAQRPADQILNEVYRSSAAWNESALASSKLDDLLDQARQSSDLARRRAIYGEIQTFLFDEGGTLIPFHINTTSAISSKVKGLPPVQTFSIRWQAVSMAE